MAHEIHAFSLLAPEGAKPCTPLGDTAVNDLSLEYLSRKMSQNDTEQAVLLSMLRAMPSDAATVAYRQAVYRDLREEPAFCGKLMEIFDAMQFGAIDDSYANYSNSSILQLIDRVRTLDQYCTAISGIRELLQGKQFRSAAMQQFSEYITSIYESSGFSKLTEDILVLGDDILGIKSMTLGINFDHNFTPKEAGILSLNTYEFGEKGFLEKFLQFHRKHHPEDKDLQQFTMLTHAKPAEAKENLLMNNLCRLIEEMLPSVTVRLRRALKRYTDMSGIMLARLGNELLFYTRFVELEERLTQAGYACAIPDCTANDTLLRGFYNIKLALCRLDGIVENEIVCNTLRFTQERPVMILTGPNQGGKTVFTQGIGLAFLLAQHGVFAPCSEGRLRLCDGIFTHFPADENRTVSFGRLGEEAVRFREICAAATRDSLLLFNESFATTSHTESLYIAKNALQYLCLLGARTCFNTHMHELGADTDSLRPEGASCGAVSVVMGKRGTPDAYVVHEGVPDGLSDAKAIAEQYGITFSQLCSNGTAPPA
ncbi:MAG: hypothetical protein IKN55_03515 [Oscillospiraceae bacterium]|nr:hypothetical protein [Oscillospiraceae bacterium]